MQLRGIHIDTRGAGGCLCADVQTTRSVVGMDTLTGSHLVGPDFSVTLPRREGDPIELGHAADWLAGPLPMRAAFVALDLRSDRSVRRLVGWGGVDNFLSAIGKRINNVCPDDVVFRTGPDTFLVAIADLRPPRPQHSPKAFEKPLPLRCLSMPRRAQLRHASLLPSRVAVARQVPLSCMRESIGPSARRTQATHRSRLHLKAMQNEALRRHDRAVSDRCPAPPHRRQAAHRVTSAENAVVVELKQWSDGTIGPSAVEASGRPTRPGNLPEFGPHNTVTYSCT